jgi:hypothetical protein
LSKKWKGVKLWVKSLSFRGEVKSYLGEVNLFSNIDPSGLPIKPVIKLYSLDPEHKNTIDGIGIESNVGRGTSISLNVEEARSLMKLLEVGIDAVSHNHPVDKN